MTFNDWFQPAIVAGVTVGLTWLAALGLQKSENMR